MYKPSAPIETNFTPLLAIKSNALFTLAILWNLILPRSGFGNVSPEITSSNSISFKPFRKSSSILSIAVPAFLKCELHHAVKVCNKTNCKLQFLISKYTYNDHCVNYASWELRDNFYFFSYFKNSVALPTYIIIRDVIFAWTRLQRNDHFYWYRTIRKYDWCESSTYHCNSLILCEMRIFAWIKKIHFADSILYNILSYMCHVSNQEILIRSQIQSYIKRLLPRCLPNYSTVRRVNKTKIELA